MTSRVSMSTPPWSRACGEGPCDASCRPNPTKSFTVPNLPRAPCAYAAPSRTGSARRADSRPIPARIVVGAGSQLLDAALVQLLRPGGSVALENPGYPRLAQIYESAGLSVRPIGLDDEGMSMEELRASDASLVHVMPSHQFPTGIVTSISRRYELLAWASETEGRYIVEDDYDAPFRMAGRPVASLASIDVAGHVIYTNTFSKSLARASHGLHGPAA